MSSATIEAPMTVRELAELFRVSEKTVYRWIKDGDLPAYAVMRVGRAIYLKRDGITRWLSAEQEEAG